MPLSTPAQRKHLHTRQLTFTGYEREDGLFDIEGHLVDTKTYDFENKDRGGIKAGEALHNMSLRLTIDTTFHIRSVEAVMDDTPFNYCPSITPAFEVLVGQQIGPGWNRRVRELLGGTKGCTHLVEMLSSLATASFQTIYPALSNRKSTETGESKKDKPSILDGCHAMDKSGPLVQERWPEFFEPKP